MDTSGSESRPEMRLPKELHIGSVVIPAIYVRLAGIGAVFAVLWAIGQALN